MIWFYPLNELEISGYEAVAVVLFSPLLLGIPFIKQLVTGRWMVALFRSFVLFLTDALGVQLMELACFGLLVYILN